MVLSLFKIKKLTGIAGLIMILLLVAWYMWPDPVRRNIKDKPVTINYGETEFHENRSDKPSFGFCARYRMEREKARSRELSILNGLIDKSNSDAKARQAAALRLVEISNDIEKEVKAENLVRCRGVDDCVAIIQPEIATIVISGQKKAWIEDEDIISVLSQTLGYEEDQVRLVYYSG